MTTALRLLANTSLRYTLSISAATCAIVICLPAFAATAIDPGREHVDEKTVRYCAVPMHGFRFKNEDRVELQQVAGMIHPVYTFSGTKFGLVLTTNGDRFIPYLAPFPRNPFDGNYARENWDNRIVGRALQGGVYTLTPGSAAFERLDDKVGNVGYGPSSWKARELR